MTVVSHFQTQEILAARGQGAVETSLDLGLSRVEVELTADGAVFPEGVVGWKRLEKTLKSDKKCYRVEDGGLRQISAHSETTGWVRSLCPTAGAPTMLVSGFPMHRIKDTEPWADTEEKIGCLGKVHGEVLDTATGLGYTAILAARRGASKVVTVELDPTGLEICRQNPWSKDLFALEAIESVVGDSVEWVKGCEAGRFSAVVHDPPTKQFGGAMYSEAFYRDVLRVLSRKGEFFHYIGDPKSGLGRSMTEGVIRRMKSAGFSVVERVAGAFGVVGRIR